MEIHQSVENEEIKACSIIQLKLLDDIEAYLQKHGEKQTIEFIRALKDSLK